MDINEVKSKAKQEFESEQFEKAVREEKEKLKAKKRKKGMLLKKIKDNLSNIIIIVLIIILLFTLHHLNGKNLFDSDKIEIKPVSLEQHEEIYKGLMYDLNAPCRDDYKKAKADEIIEQHEYDTIKNCFKKMNDNFIHKNIPNPRGY